MQVTHTQRIQVVASKNICSLSISYGQDKSKSQLELHPPDFPDLSPQLSLRLPVSKAGREEPAHQGVVCLAYAPFSALGRGAELGSGSSWRPLCLSQMCPWAAQTKIISCFLVACFCLLKKKKLFFYKRSHKVATQNDFGVKPS